MGEAASVISSAAENLDDRLGGHGGKIVSKLSYQIQKGVEQLQSSIGADSGEIRCLMLGFDKAGKTTIIRKLEGVEYPLEYEKTLGYNSAIVKYKTNFNIFDVGGDESIRGMWPQFYLNILPYDCMIFVLDSTDTVTAH